jgi:hypothetical protein
LQARQAGAGRQVNNSARQNMADLRTAFDDLIWFQYGVGSKTVAPAYVSATSFTLAGADVTATWHAGRRIKAVGATTGTIYGTIASASFAASTTTITVVWDSGTLANEALTIYLSQVPVTGAPLGANALVGTIAGDNAKPGSVGERLTCVSKDNASNSCTMSIASPCVVTQAGHGYSLAQVLNFTTTGALPAGIAAGATYYVIPIDANIFNLASSVANALAGTKISTSGSQSGAHSANGWANLTSNVATDIGGILLMPGDWDIYAAATFVPDGPTTSNLTALAIATSSGGFNHYPGATTAIPQFGNTTPYGTTICAGPYRVSINTPMTYWAVARSVFGVSYMQVQGGIFARRSR